MPDEGLPAAAGRSPTLPRVFLVASGAILLSGAAVVALVLTRSLREQAISDRMAIDRRPDLFAADGPSRAVA